MFDSNRQPDAPCTVHVRRVAGAAISPLAARWGIMNATVEPGGSFGDAVRFVPQVQEFSGG